LGSLAAFAEKDGAEKASKNPRARSTNKIVATRQGGKSSDDAMPCREQSHFD